MLKVVAISVLLSGGLASSVLGQGGDRTVDVIFDAGATEVAMTDQIIGRDAVLYRLGAEAGQRMNVTLRSAHTAIYFNVYAPGSGPGDAALAVSNVTDDMVPDLNQFSAILPVSGDYTVMVYLYRAAARREESAAFTVDFSITGALSDVVSQDFADGLMGGPDFWSVTAQSGLNLRSEPSRAAEVRAVLKEGAVLQNSGCRMAEGQRWCEVNTTFDPLVSGWVAGRYLAEAAGPQSK